MFFCCRLTVFPVSLMFCVSAGFMAKQYALCLTLAFSVVTHRCAHMQAHSEGSVACDHMSLAPLTLLPWNVSCSASSLPVLSYFPWVSPDSEQTTEFPCICLWHDGQVASLGLFWCSSPLCPVVLEFSWVQSPSVVLQLRGGYWRSPVPVWRVGEDQQPAGDIFKDHRVLSKVLGLWEQASGLGLYIPSCCWCCTCGWNVAQPLGKVHVCRTGSVLCRCLLPLWAGAACSFGAAGKAAPLPARKTVEMAFYCFICLPVILSLSAFCRGWGDWYNGEVCHFEEWPCGYFCFAAVLDRAALNCRAAFGCGQTLTINIPFSAELGPRTADTELPEAADLHYQ